MSDVPLREGCVHRLWLLPIINFRLCYQCEWCAGVHEITFDDAYHGLGVEGMGERVADDVGGSYAGSLDVFGMTTWAREHLPAWFGDVEDRDE